MNRKKILILPFLFSLLLSFFPVVSFANDQSLVYIIPIKNTVEKGLSEFIDRGIKTAEEKKADVIIFDMDTPGGAVDAAAAIGKTISETKIKTVTYINQDAISAGSYIALNTDMIYMDEGGRFGAAGIIDGQGNTAGEKAQSYWLSAMRGAAEKGGKDPRYAMAMADKSIAIPELGDDENEFLTLTAAESLHVDYSNGTVSNLDELLGELGMENAKVERMDESFADKVARFVTNPLIIPILLSIGSLGLIFELFSPGFGVPGFVGISSLLLFFYGHLVSGLAGYETIILFAVGILLVLLEFFIVGGIAGTLGIVAIIGSIFLAGGNAYHIAISICIAIAVSIIATILLVKVFGRKMKFFKKIVLRDSTSTEEGYVSNKTRNDLVGKTGITMTALRPSGTVVIGDERIDVVSEGNFIGKDVKVKIVKAEGSRIVVREFTDIDLHKEEN
ncbi:MULTISPECIES: nodulation protein NfeD [unclassified Niallia]|uniref:NfeD family protein n=1 Tax=Niallia TaxID=2837506 RepID=UPI001EDB90B3|nr:MULTISPECIES: nodulation protein NfeD [unclassified Niallia]MCM3030103.1 nodulation protein NfeD [Niallia sp. MER 6]MDL0436552.1 nodulation protein NfeD [Niallia sp. SS-2023]UPO86615.1 nodulation protein NfeD [Niallia sp. Man26]